MDFYKRLQIETTNQRESLLSAPIIYRSLQGEITLDDYVSFLAQAYHHVKHTVPLLMACGSRLSEEKEWLRKAIGDYIEEEMGHQEWILNDIEHCGYDKEVVRSSIPLPATELMVSYAYDMVQRINPLGFFGMVQVLEGTSIAIASQVADVIKNKLELPQSAFSYLYSHGALDQGHIKFFENLMNRITLQEEQVLIIHSARMFYQLYGDIFRSLNPAHGVPAIRPMKAM
jgi:pyrroloquinoline quinone (PQQ) biosynthesis protein C